MRRLAPPTSALALALALAAPAAAQFDYAPPGTLQGPGGSVCPGHGRVDERVYAPGMRFPIEEGPVYANSQIYGHGGYMGPGGGQCETANYAFPWYDNFCEERRWDMPLCPSGNGHQGQDIRPRTCADDTHWAVATVDGTITNIGTYSVYLTGDDGRRYDYLHMAPSSLRVRVGQRVSRGARLGRVSNAFGGTPTTIHLHFNIRMNVSGVGSVYAPTYMSLVESYRELMGLATPRFRAEYVNQTFPLASRPFELAPGETAAGHIELRNTGSETWRPGETFLGTTEPRDGDSPLAASDWPSARRAAAVDRVVPPGETGRFAFTVRAPSAPGEYPQFFNLVQEGVSWFADDGGPPDAQLQVRVTVVAPSCPADIGGSWQCEGAARVRCLDGTVEREDCEESCVDGACVALPPVDADGDGHRADVDCDDGDGSIHPGAEDVCGDGVDANCDGVDACGVDAGRPGIDAAPGADASAPEADAGPTWRPTGEVRRAVGGCSATSPGSGRSGSRRSGSGAAALALLALVIRRRR